MLFNIPFWDTQVTLQNLIEICYMIFAFVVGFFLKDIDRNKNFIIWLYWGVSLFWLLHVDFSRLTIDFSFFNRTEDIAIYLAMGEGYAILSMLALYVCRLKKWMPAIITIASIPILYFINSRASLFLYIMVTFFSFVALGKKYRHILVLLLIVSVFAVLSYVNIDLLLDSRVLRLIIHTSEDTSLQARNLYMSDELSHLWGNWFLGDYSNYLIREGPGGYIHNFLSFWAQYGFIPFLGMCILFIWAIVFNISQWTKHKLNYMFMIMLFVFSLTATLFAKSYYYQLIWVSLGMTFREYYKYYSALVPAMRAGCIYR